MSPRHHANRTTILHVGIVAATLFALVVLLSAALASGGEALRERAGGGSAAGAPGGASRDAGGRATVLGRLPARVSESSGVAPSEAHADVLWTHNDGGEGVLYAISVDGGARRASVGVVGAEAVDWEDLARGPCPGGGARGDCLFIADIGDNDATRESVRILVVPEPERLEDAMEIAPLVTVAFRYPEGATDAEALAIGSDGRALIVSKGMDGDARVYELAPDAFTGGGDGVREARLVTPLPIDVRRAGGSVTGAALSPDGRSLAVRTLADVYVFAAEDLSRAPQVCPVGEAQSQGEAIAFLDATTMVLTSEGAESPVLALRCP